MTEWGISVIGIKTIEVPHRLPDFDEYWRLLSTLLSGRVLQSREDPEIVTLRE